MAMIFFLILFIFISLAAAKNLSGRIFIQVESHGEAWYVSPENQSRYYLGRPADAFGIMRNLSFGISNADLERLFGKMSGAKNYNTVDKNLANRLAGKILLQVESHGEAYYINPDNLVGYYLGSPKEAFQIMRTFGIGITNDDLFSISVAETKDEYSSIKTFEEEESPAPSNANTVPEMGVKEEIIEDLGYHPIIFALNKGYVDQLPDWKEKADQFIERINTIFQKTTSENFKITKYLTYNDNEYGKLSAEPEKYKEFYQHSEGDGFTYILLIHKLGLSRDDLMKQYGVARTLDSTMVQKIDNKEYYAVRLRNFEEVNVLMHPTATNSLSAAAHEIGHLFGTGSPEWYMYLYSDCTRLDPLFEDYNINHDPYFKNDPMTSSGLARLEDIEFNELSSAIINKGANLKYYSSHKWSWYSHTGKIHVVDKNGMPISGATIKIFCARLGCYSGCDVCSGVKYGSGVPANPEADEILTTDENGYAKFEIPLLGIENGKNKDNCIAKAIKAYYRDKSGAGVVNFIDLQKNYVLDNSNDYVLDIILE